MLWSTLHNKLGKQPLSITQHNHVAAIVDGRRVELDLKFDTKNQPYLVPRAVRQDLPYKQIYHYTVCQETPDPLGSGATTDRERRFTTEREAMEALHDGRNKLTRLVRDNDDNIVHQYWDLMNQCWTDMDGKRLPY